MSKYTYSYLQQIVDDQEQERFDLEFKRCDALRWKDRSEKKEVIDNLSKDVSAMANSDGGVVIYGIEENPDYSTAEKIDPDAFTSSEGGTKKQEWLDQVIRDSIYPHPEVTITTIFKDDDLKTDEWYFVVEVTKGMVAHQARDKKFHTRVNTTTAAMEYYEILDVMNRSGAPDLHFVPKITKLENQLYILPRVENRTNVTARDTQMRISILSSTSKYSRGQITGFESAKGLFKEDYVYISNPNLSPVHKGLPLSIGDGFYANYLIDHNDADLPPFEFKIEVFADKMIAKIWHVRIKNPLQIPDSEPKRILDVPTEFLEIVEEEYLQPR